MILMPSNLNGITLQIFADSTNIIVKIVFDLVINQVFSVLCAEYDMSIDFGKRLRHSEILSGLRPFRTFIFC
jgi:hypothetical protein